MSKVLIKNVMASEFPEAKLLSSGFQGAVYAYSENTVLKAMSRCLLWESDNSELPAEMLSIQFANNVNNLVVKFKDHIFVENMGHILALERLFPCLPTAFTKEEIAVAIETAEAQLNELWAAGWCHGDLKRPTQMVGTDPMQLFNNIMLTEVDGHCVVRLVDLGCPMLKQYDSQDLLNGYLANDKSDWEEFKNWILNYSRD
jgi:hypothetical protein